MHNIMLRIPFRPKLVAIRQESSFAFGHTIALSDMTCTGARSSRPDVQHRKSLGQSISAMIF
jgi:hypothetical protein